MTGTVVFWNNPRGYGFIRPDGTDDRVFVHISSCLAGNVPRVDAKVRYEFGDPLRSGQKQQAVRVELLSNVNAGADALKAGL